MTRMGLMLPTSDNPASVIVADAVEGLRRLPDGCVHCVCTSPPFYGLRDYGTAKWEGGAADCDHLTPAAHGYRPAETSTLGPNRDGISEANSAHSDKVKRKQYSGACEKCGAVRVDSQVGLEPSLDDYIGRLVDIFREVRRVLHPSGVVWLNLGDSYTSGGRSNRDPGQSKIHPAFTGEHNGATRWRPSDPAGMKPKDLMGVPWSVAFALRSDGWYLRSGCPWVKRNSMPESITDRPATALEYVFLLSKSERYYFDHTAVRCEAIWADDARAGNGRIACGGKRNGEAGTGQESFVSINPAGRNRRNTDWFFESWQGMYTGDDGLPLAFVVNPVPSDFAHFAMWPPLLVEPMVKAGSSERGVCPACFAPWRRIVKTNNPSKRAQGEDLSNGAFGGRTANAQSSKSLHRDKGGVYSTAQVLGWEPSCKCGHDHTVPALVLDPFAGSGTTLAVAVKLKRRAVGIELNPEYAKLAERRLAEPLGTGGLYDTGVPVVLDLFG